MDPEPPSLSPTYSRRARSLFHLGAIVLIALALWLAESEPRGGSLSSYEVTATPPTVSPLPVPNAKEPDPTPTMTPATVPTAMPRIQDLIQAPVLHTATHPEPRTGVVTYTVQAGDSVQSIADRFGLERETIVWANEDLETDPHMLYVGQVLSILPVNGVYHTVQRGEKLADIAKQYKVPIEAITNCEYNGLDDPADLSGLTKPGRQLVVPGGIKPFKPHFVRFQMGTISRDAPQGDGTFVWPVGGEIAQEYWNLHRAIDIAGAHGDAVVAADAGVVVYASWECSGYGNLVIVDHGNGFTSYYAHLYGFFVDVGQPVRRGEPLGVRGNTGRSTGPHLHFEIRRDGVQCDPLDYLPDG